MHSFRNDYSEGAHPAILEALTETNLTQTVGYCLDPHCAAAADTIRRLTAAPEADVHFLVGGTQVNLITIAAHLAPYEAVIAAHTGHVNVHETGAIEATGHKVCAAYAPDGKLTPELVESVLAQHNGTEHMVAPKLVYISDTTEIGTIYTRAELATLRRCCDSHGLFLYLDGARLGSALTAEGNDLTLPDLAALTDAFTIGGTKNGALFGEALILARPHDHFRWHMKQRGAVLAKGRLLGIQFEALLKDGLYFDLGRRCQRPGHPPARTAWRLTQGSASRCRPLNQQSSRCCPTAPWRLWRPKATASRRTTPRMRGTPASASSPAGPRPRRRWSSCWRTWARS